MPVKIGVLCSSEGEDLAILLRAVADGRLPAEIKVVIADRDSDALYLAREAGFYGVFIPRQAFHANRDGYERRLTEILSQAEAEALVLAGFDREVGPVLSEAWSGRLFGQGLEPGRLVPELEKWLRSRLFQVVS